MSGRFTNRRLAMGVAAAALIAFGCSGGGGAAPTLPPPLNVSAWVGTQSGSMPLVLIAPHGGDLSPADLPDRSCEGCSVLNDAGTQELAYAIAAAFEARIGKRPYIVANRLHRRKFDANREVAEATSGYAPLAPLWSAFHERIDSAKAGALRVHPRILVLDLHGHAHTKQRLELGYLLTASQLRLGNDALAPALAGSSIAQLAMLRPATDSGAQLIRGPRSLGARFAALGVPAVPSDADPAPLEGDAYFSGGFNTQRHGSQLGGPVDAIQIESHRVGVRDTAASRALFAEAVVTAILGLLDDYYGWSPT